MKNEPVYAKRLQKLTLYIVAKLQKIKAKPQNIGVLAF